MTLHACGALLLGRVAEELTATEAAQSILMLRHFAAAWALSKALLPAASTWTVSK